MLILCSFEDDARAFIQLAIQPTNYLFRQFLVLAADWETINSQFKFVQETRHWTWIVCHFLASSFCVFFFSSFVSVSEKAFSPNRWTVDSGEDLFLVSVENKVCCNDHSFLSWPDRPALTVIQQPTKSARILNIAVLFIERSILTDVLCVIFFIINRSTWILPDHRERLIARCSLSLCVDQTLFFFSVCDFPDRCAKYPMTINKKVAEN